MKVNDMVNYTSMEHLRNGWSVTIRAIRPDDKGIMIDALSKVSPQSLYLRMFSGKRKFSDVFQLPRESFKRLFVEVWDIDAQRGLRCSVRIAQ